MLEGLGVARAMGHLEHLGLMMIVVFCEEEDIAIVGVNCHCFAVVVGVVGILDVDVLNVVGADHNVMTIPVVGHFWLLELVNSKRGPGDDECAKNRRWYECHL